MIYHEYIRSREWRDHPARRAELKASGSRCRLCNAGAEDSVIEVHHRTYENLGNEQPGDLTTLCQGCHRIVTDHLRRVRYADREPRHANVNLALESPSPLFDPTFKEMI
jgi:5-methylcytosine-specific restriction endonuclease McrA